jgi:hypothetical protein
MLQNIYNFLTPIINLIKMFKKLLFREESIVVLRGHVQGEFYFDADCGLGDAPEQVNGDLALGFIFLDVVDALTRDHKNALLVPPEHVDLFQLVRK